MFFQLPLLDYKRGLRIKQDKGKKFIWGAIRKKWMVFTKEEVVRQLLIQFLIEDRQYPAGRISVEKQIHVLDQQRRFDLFLSGDDGKPIVLIECKSPDTKLHQKHIDQVGRYNLVLRAPYLILTNGIDCACSHIDFATGTFNQLVRIPTHGDIRRISESDEKQVE